MGETAAYRAIPSVDKILRGVVADDLPRPLVVDLVRRVLDQTRLRLSTHPSAPIDIAALVEAELTAVRLSRLRPVINGTGIIIHTNFGRCPMGPRVVAAISSAASGYCNLEFDLITGQRGGRAAYVELALARLCQSEAATVVNNCAAGLVLILQSLTRSGGRREVIVSRGELVQIGGGFRIPEIIESTGAVLREVGTTNRTEIGDYERAVNDKSALILKVHRSNFYMGGFTAAPTRDELAKVGRERNLPLVEDLGSGAVFDTLSLGGGETEPTPADCIAGGASLISFSGDKLLGGPQAGIIAGSASLVSALKKDPFFRALRCDKLALAALQETVDIHLSDDEELRQREVPALHAMHEPLDALRLRARGLVATLSRLGIEVTAGDSEAQVGGGSLPKTIIPSVAIDILPPPPESVDGLARRLRVGRTPVIGYISNGQLRFDLRTVFDELEPEFVSCVEHAITSARRES